MTIVLQIIAGLIGLGIVVFVHEAGHLIAAKLVGIEVEAFSLGWGKRIAGFRYKGTDYRLSVFPIGGFCRMKGEEAFQKAVENNEKEIPKESGSFYGVHPWKRIVVLFAGPLVNFLFAVIVLSVVWLVGFSVESFQNRVVLASEFPEVTGISESEASPAEEAGIRSGDVIVSINGEEVRSYRDIQQTVTANPDRRLDLTVRRDGRLIELTVQPDLDRQTGAGQIGIYPWIDPSVGSVTGPAAEAGIQAGDEIVRAAGREIRHSLDLISTLQGTEGPLSLTIRRSGQTREVQVTPRTVDGGIRQIGMSFEGVSVQSEDYGLFGAVGQGVSQTVETLTLTIRGIALLFQGVDVQSAVAGPIRIIALTGEVAAEGFSRGLGTGFRQLFNFLALLSVVLFFMNLLPIPVLDGGQILLNAFDWISPRPLRPLAVQRYQTVGAVLVFALIIFAFTNDILFLARG